MRSLGRRGTMFRSLREELVHVGHFLLCDSNLYGHSLAAGQSRPAITFVHLIYLQRFHVHT